MTDPGSGWVVRRFDVEVRGVDTDSEDHRRLVLGHLDRLQGGALGVDRGPGHGEHELCVDPGLTSGGKLADAVRSMILVPAAASASVGFSTAGDVTGAGTGTVTLGRLAAGAGLRGTRRVGPRSAPRSRSHMPRTGRLPSDGAEGAESGGSGDETMSWPARGSGSIAAGTVQAFAAPASSADIPGLRAAGSTNARTVPARAADRR